MELTQGHDLPEELRQRLAELLGNQVSIEETHVVNGDIVAGGHK